VETFMKHTTKMLLATLLVALAMSFAAIAADAPAARSGKQVVDEVCIKCHGTGEMGAPKIGDKKAWHKRAAKGLSGLTTSALKGVRNMPPHGGRLDLTDLEMKRAIAYMVNQSGGKWREPVDPARRADRSGKEIVQARCSQCHETGKGGAPRIGDKAAWIPRMKNGMDEVVRSAINGHGGMPARGGLAELNDREMRAAVNYMWNPASAAKK
jgi:cytochrome c5